MRTIIKSNQKIELKEATSNNTVRFIIKGVIGFGASCIVYDAFKEDGENNLIRVILKEFYPYNADAIRDENLHLHFNDIDALNDMLERFVNGYRRQIAFQNDDNTANITSGIFGIYIGKETKYVAMMRTAGMTLTEKSKETTLFEFFEICLSVAKALKKYHNNNYLHLDIKPDNIFALNETNEMVVLFDFDSLANMTDVAEGSASLSYSNDYAAPELKQGKNLNIDVRADFYSLGAMVFERLFGRCPNSVDIAFRFSSVTLNDVEELNTYSPHCKRLIADFIRCTISPSPHRRFKNDNECIESLKSITASLEQENFLVTTLPHQSYYFVGRSNEIKQIHENLQKNNIVFLSGVGGIGKSTLAIEYAKAYATEYDSVSFGVFSDSLQSFINDDNVIHISGYHREPQEKPENYFIRKRMMLQELAGPHTLIIVDNYNHLERETIEGLSRLNCKIIITTRMNTNEYGYAFVSVKHFSNLEDCEKLFYEYYKKQLNDEEKENVDALLELTNYHTFSIELLAKQMRASRALPSDILHQLKNHSIHNMPKERVIANKDNRMERKDSFSFISELFDIAALEEEQQYVLLNLSLMPAGGLDVSQFVEWCQLNGYDAINELNEAGWLSVSDDDIIFLHPVIAELIISRLKPSYLNCQSLIDSLSVYTFGEDVSHSHILKIVAIIKSVIGKIEEDSNLISFYIQCINILVQNSDYVLAREVFEKSFTIVRNNDTLSTEEVISFYCTASKLFEKMTDYSMAAVLKERERTLLQNTVGSNSDYERWVRAELDLFDLYLKHSDVPCIYTNADGTQVETNRRELVIQEGQSIIKQVRGIDWFDPELLARAYNTLSHAYRLRKKEESYIIAEQQALKAQECLKAKHLEKSDQTAWTYYYLGEATSLTHKENIQIALDYYQAALELRLKLENTSNSESVAVCYNVIGNRLSQNGKYSEASDYFRQAKSIRKHLFGELSTEYAWTLFNEAENYFRRNNRGDNKKAKRIFEEVMSIYHSILNIREHKFLGLTYEYLGDICDRERDYDNAVKYYELARKQLSNEAIHDFRIRSKLSLARENAASQ